MLVRFVLFLLTVTLSAPAFAQEEDDNRIVSATDTNLRLRPNQQQRLLGQLFMAPVYFFTQITVHEGSHALMAEAMGYNVIDFRPYPHIATFSRTITNDSGERVRVTESELVFGSMAYVSPSGVYDDTRRSLISIAPSLMDILLFTTADLLLTYVVDPHSAGAPFMLFGLMVTPLVDFVTGMNCTSPACDISRFTDRSGIPRGATMMVGYTMIFVAVWRCLHHFRRLFMERRPERESRRRIGIIVSPAFNENSTGGAVISGTF
jgi:hypothetical protein